MGACVKSHHKAYQCILACIVLSITLLPAGLAQAYAQDDEAVGLGDAAEQVVGESAQEDTGLSTDAGGVSPSQSSEESSQSGVDSVMRDQSQAESTEAELSQLGGSATQDLTGWYSPDDGETYCWYDHGTRRTTAGWKVTGLVPGGGSGGLQRYWLGADGVLARDRLVDPAEGHGAWWAYATSSGAVVRGRLKVGSSVYLANNDGRLAGPGWVVSSAYGQGLQRYYVDPEAHACVVGYSADGWPHYTTEQGHVLRGRLKVGDATYVADNNGRITSATGVDLYMTSTGPRTYPNYANWYDKPNPFSAPSFSEVSSLYPAFSAFSGAGGIYIPGLVLTNLGLDYCDVMIPQGICATDRYLIVSAHCSGGKLVSTIANGELSAQGGNATLLASLRKNHLHAKGSGHTHDSVLYVIDRQSGTYLKTIDISGLPEAAKHMGGITADDTSLWLATSSSLSKEGLAREARLPLSVIDEAVSNPRDCVTIKLDQLEFVALQDTSPVMREASFNVWHDGKLWVGDFYTSKLACMTPTTVGGKTALVAEGIYDIPPETQGATFVESEGRSYLLLNASYGRRNTSRTYLYDITDGIGSLERSAARTMWLPPMLEEGCTWDGLVYQLFESGSTFYSAVDGESQSMRTSLIVDQICIGDVPSILTASTDEPELTGAPYLTQVILAASMDVRVYNDVGTLVCVVENGEVDQDSLGVSVDAHVEDGQTVLELSDDISYSLRLTQGGEQGPSQLGVGEGHAGQEVVVQSLDEDGTVVSSRVLPNLEFDETGVCELHVGAAVGTADLTSRLG